MRKFIRNIIVLSILSGIFLFPGIQNSRAAGTLFLASLAPPADRLCPHEISVAISRGEHLTGQADYSHQSLFQVPVKFPLPAPLSATCPVKWEATSLGSYLTGASLRFNSLTFSSTVRTPPLISFPIFFSSKLSLRLTPDTGAGLIPKPNGILSML